MEFYCNNIKETTLNQSKSSKVWKKFNFIAKLVFFFLVRVYSLGLAADGKFLNGSFSQCFETKYHF